MRRLQFPRTCAAARHPAQGASLTVILLLSWAARVGAAPSPAAAQGDPTARKPQPNVGTPSAHSAAPSGDALARRFEVLRASYGDLTYPELVRRLDLRRASEAPLTFDPTRVRYYDNICRALDLAPQEKEIYRRTGLVSVDPAQHYSMASSYLAIYTRDLPVLITTDSILHAMHRSFDNMLVEIEVGHLAPTMAAVLKATHETLQSQSRALGDPALRASARDIDLYLTVARNLLAGSDASAPNPLLTPNCLDPTQRNTSTCKDLAAAEIVHGDLQVHSLFDQDGSVKDALKGVASAEMAPDVPIYGGLRQVDWSQFKPRGHYTKSIVLQRYFRAMMWLGRADLGFYMSQPPPGSGIYPDLPRERRDAVVFTWLVSHAGQLEPLAALGHVIEFLVGMSDNATTNDLDSATKRAGLRNFADFAKQDAVDGVLAELARGGGGGQGIRSQVIDVPHGRSYETPLPDIFQFFGQRFVLDSFLMSKVVFDSISFEGNRPHRMMPMGLDIMAALGNDEAVGLLEPEITTYKYAANLLAGRTLIAEQPPKIWDATLYNVWLSALSKLDRVPAGSEVPQLMRRRVWQRKQLQTQLGSWAELRHDTILYVKQSYTGRAVCEYPTGYVEPYPEFFARLAFFADEAKWRLHALKLSTAPIVSFLENFAETVRKLQRLATKELAGQPFDAAEQLFVKETINVESKGGGCGGPRRIYTGWYPRLIYNGTPESWEPTVADVHTDPNSGSVLEVGVGDVDFMVAAIDNHGDRAAFVGPVYSYYEFTSGARLTDEEWRHNIIEGRLPPRPEWTRAFQGPTKRTGTGTPPNAPAPKPSFDIGSPTRTGSLGNSAVAMGMNAIKAKVADCYSRFKLAGIAMVNVVISRDGNVSSATVVGQFAGTDTGACVEAAVRTARFPPSDGLAIPYPFHLR